MIKGNIQCQALASMCDVYTNVCMYIHTQTCMSTNICTYTTYIHIQRGGGNFEGFFVLFCFLTTSECLWKRLTLLGHLSAHSLAYIWLFFLLPSHLPSFSLMCTWIYMIIEDTAYTIILCLMYVEVRGQLCVIDYSIPPSLLGFWGSWPGCTVTGSPTFCLFVLLHEFKMY